ncbi:hypothetical protein KQH65_02350 [archaeon]|nr:hypothetical protein [archaeon]
MQKCENCGTTGDISLREATIKDQGKKWICQDCWTTLFDKNKMISGSSCGGACGIGCASCRHG